MSSRDEQIALRSVKGQLETAGRPTTRLPPPVVIRRKQIPLRPVPAKQADSSVAESSVSDEGGRSVKEESNVAVGAVADGRTSSECCSPQSLRHRDQPAASWALTEADKVRAQQDSRRKWGFLAKSASANGTARVFTEAGTTSTSSSSYDRDLPGLSRRPLEHAPLDFHRKEAATSVGRSFASRISDSTSSDFQEESELSSEERDALIEGTKTPLAVCRNRLTKFGARKRIGAAASAREHFLAGDRLLGLRENTSSSSSTVRSPIEDIPDEVREAAETLGVDPLLGDPASAPTTLSLDRNIASWTQEGKELLVKSVSSANTLAPTTMTCIKSPRAMSEHLLGQLEVPVTPTVLGALRVKGGSLKEGDRSERVTDVPRQRWSSVRVKGGSTKSLLLENGGPQAKPLKGALTAEVFLVVD